MPMSIQLNLSPALFSYVQDGVSQGCNEALEVMDTRQPAQLLIFLEDANGISGRRAEPL